MTKLDGKAARTKLGVGEHVAAAKPPLHRHRLPPGAGGYERLDIHSSQIQPPAVIVDRSISCFPVQSAESDEEPRVLARTNRELDNSASAGEVKFDDHPSHAPSGGSQTKVCFLSGDVGG